jgi:3-oxoacyl-[acyl-carrier protein] reductase
VNDPPDPAADELSLDLTGQVVVITGAARGIGRACAHLLATSGASLALCDRRAAELVTVAEELAAAGHDPLTMTADVREEVESSAFTTAVIERFGVVDVLVNNAGGSFQAPFLDVSPKGESMLIAENFTSVTRLIRLLVPVMPSGGSIINLTSVEAHQASPGFAVYAAMKAGLASLTASLALEFAGRGIRVNAVAPDAIMTAGEESARTENEVAPSRYEPVTLPPLGRTGSPAEAARVVLFLASRLSSFVTGTTIHVDGGTGAAGGWRLV